MARTSQIAQHHRREDIERELVEGQPILKIAAQYGVSAESLYRWQSQHVAPALKDAMRISEQHSTTRLLDRLAGIADDHARARKILMESGALALAVRAGDAETRALNTLLDRLGVDSTDTLELLREGDKLAHAIGRLAREHPAAGQHVVKYLRDLDATTMADALEAVTSVSENNKEIQP